MRIPLQANGNQCVESLTTVEMLEILEARISALRWLRVCVEPAENGAARRPRNVHPFARIEEL